MKFVLLLMILIFGLFIAWAVPQLLRTAQEFHLEFGGIETMWSRINDLKKPGHNLWPGFVFCEDQFARALWPRRLDP